MDIAAPKRRRLVLGDEDSLAEEGQPQLAHRHSFAESEDGHAGLSVLTALTTPNKTAMAFPFAPSSRLS